ncbi:MAG: PepSY domain-containing protein [Rhodocyclaceae bacterium]|nr:PepSY domain-containing protein [Rhodocyclaceae bacterium]
MLSRITTQWRRTLASLVMLMALASPGPGVSFAADNPDHDRARQAVEAGDVLPLRTILDRVEREYPGQVMEVELDREKGEWVYEIKLLRKGGVLMKLKIQARDGTILGFKEKLGKPHKPYGQGEPR